MPMVRRRSYATARSTDCHHQRGSQHAATRRSQATTAVKLLVEAMTMGSCGGMWGGQRRSRKTSATSHPRARRRMVPIYAHASDRRLLSAVYSTSQPRLRRLEGIARTPAAFTPVHSFLPRSTSTERRFQRGTGRLLRASSIRYDPPCTRYPFVHTLAPDRDNSNDDTGTGW